MRKDLLTPKHNHREAFCLMKYKSKQTSGFGEHEKKFAQVRIWNSRDGVTPFCFQIEQLGLELHHADWQEDLYNPHYKPVKGDLIWATYDEVTGRKAMLQHLEIIKAHAADIKIKDINEYYYNKCQEDVKNPESFIEAGIKKLMDEKQPVLILVEKDWQ